MNCWKGICKYKTDDNFCRLDGLECDIQRIGSPGARYDTCHYEREHEEFRLSCRETCYSFDWCEET